MNNLKIGIIVLLVIAILALCYMIQQKNLKESFDVDKSSSYEEIPSCSTNESNYSSEPSPLDSSSSQEELVSTDLSGNSVPSSCYPKGNLNPAELLPKSEASSWSEANPIGSGALEDQNFLDAGFHSGINTVGNSLRNANMQLRSEFPNPQKKVSPWSQSTIEPDMNRKPLEVGME